MIVNKYRIFCVTDNKYEYVWSEETPTVCPKNEAHEINVESISIIDRVSSNLVLTEPDNSFQMQADAVSSVCTKGESTTIDYQMVNRQGESYTVKYLNGAEIKVINAAKGDWAECSIIDIDNVLGYGANTVLKTYVVKKFLFADHVHVINATAPGAIPVGVYMRCTYHSVGTETNPEIFINFDIEVRG